jgi:hypothetical protein
MKWATSGGARPVLSWAGPVRVPARRRGGFKPLASGAQRLAARGDELVPGVAAHPIRTEMTAEGRRLPRDVGRAKP